MRTVTYVGLLAIADAINKDWHQGESIAVYAVIFIIVCTMDLTDFVRGLFREKDTAENLQ